MKVHVFNKQKDLVISKNQVIKQVCLILQNEKIFCNEVSIFFITKKEMTFLHKKYFDDPTLTDTISFPIDKPEKKNTHSCYLGDVFICPYVAKKYCRENNNNNFFEETTLYLIHGLLHLIGYKDKTEKEKRIMRKKEKSCMQVLKKYKIGLNKKHTRIWEML